MKSSKKTEWTRLGRCIGFRDLQEDMCFCHHWTLESLVNANGNLHSPGPILPAKVRNTTWSNSWWWKPSLIAYIPIFPGSYFFDVWLTIIFFLQITIGPIGTIMLFPLISMAWIYIGSINLGSDQRGYFQKSVYLH